jgi:hypothetical protein
MEKLSNLPVEILSDLSFSMRVTSSSFLQPVFSFSLQCIVTKCQSNLESPVTEEDDVISKKKEE